MQTIMVQGESVSDVNLVIALAKKLNLKIKVISSAYNFINSVRWNLQNSFIVLIHSWFSK
jgi:hypothetical protein